MSRLAATPAQLQRVLDVLATYGFKPSKLELATDGAVRIYSDDSEDMSSSEPDLLDQWRATRAPHG